MPLRFCIRSLLFSLFLGVGAAHAASWPAQPVRLVVGFPPGGMTDLLARVIQPGLEKELGVPVVVENRGGAQGVIGANVVAKSQPDGYTFAVVADSYATSPAILASMPFDAQKDLTAVSLLATSPTVISTARNSDLKSFDDLLKLARKGPGALQYGSYGTGSLVHLAMASLTREAGVEASHIPYKGGSPLMMAAIGGEVPVAISSYALASQPMANGQLRPLAVFGSERFDRLPDVPATGEQGLSKTAVFAWFAVLAPAAVPAGILDRMHDAIAKALETSAAKETLERQALKNPALSRAEFETFLGDEIGRWSRVARENGIKAGG